MSTSSFPRPRRGRPVRGRLAALTLSALLLAVPACASTPGGEASAEPRRAEPRAPTILVVENRGFLDMTVYVLRTGGQRVRLGVVTGHSTARLTIPAQLVFGATTLQFLADPIGGSRTPISNEIAVSEGDELTLVINP